MTYAASLAMYRNYRLHTEHWYHLPGLPAYLQTEVEENSNTTTYITDINAATEAYGTCECMHQPLKGVDLVVSNNPIEVKNFWGEVLLPAVPTVRHK